jgi:hypothetical protein
MTGQRHVTGAVPSDGRFAERIVSFRLADGTEVHRPFRQVSTGLAADAVPWRTARSAQGQTHYPGYYWSATTGTHVIYESRLDVRGCCSPISIRRWSPSLRSRFG